MPIPNDPQTDPQVKADALTEFPFCHELPPCPVSTWNMPPERGGKTGFTPNDGRTV